MPAQVRAPSEGSITLRAMVGVVFDVAADVVDGTAERCAFRHESPAECGGGSKPLRGYLFAVFECEWLP